jgi:hypothetical protein
MEKPVVSSRDAPVARARPCLPQCGCDSNRHGSFHSILMIVELERSPIGKRSKKPLLKSKSMTCVIDRKSSAIRRPVTGEICRVQR